MSIWLDDMTNLEKRQSQLCATLCLRGVYWEDAQKLAAEATALRRAGVSQQEAEKRVLDINRINWAEGIICHMKK